MRYQPAAHYLKRWGALASGALFTLVLTPDVVAAQSRPAPPSRPQAVSRPSANPSPPTVRHAVPRAPAGADAPQGPRRNPPSADSPGKRGSSGHGSHFGHGHTRYHGHGRHGGFYYYPWYFGYPYYYPYYLPYYPVRWYSYRAADDMGAVDLNVRPQKAAVYVNGQHIGKVDRFNGYPGYLWLEEGTYDLVFYKEGYVTTHREVSLYAGVVIDFQLELLPGEATPADEVLAAVLKEREPERVAESGSSGQDQEARAGSPEPRPHPYETRRFRPRQPRERAPGGAVEVARVLLSVDPEDASIYLDGRFLGLAVDLGGSGAGLMVNPGEHRLSVVRPGFKAQELVFEVEAGERLDLAVTLETSSEP